MLIYCFKKVLDGDIYETQILLLNYATKDILSIAVSSYNKDNETNFISKLISLTKAIDIQ